MIADELNQDDIDNLLSTLGGDDSGGGDDGGADDALMALSDDGGGDDASDASASPESPAADAGGNVNLPQFDETEIAGDDVAEMEQLLSNVNLRVKLRLGKTKMQVSDILSLRSGRVVQLESMSGDPVDILVNDRVIAKGEVIILNEAFCVRITEIFSIQEKLERQA